MIYACSASRRADLSRLMLLLLTLFAGPLLSGCGGGDSADPLPTLAQIKAEDPGTVVTTTGFVSVEPGILGSTTGESGFALQDTSGGLYVTVDPALGLDLSNVKPGRTIQITGTLGDLNGWVVLILENQEDLVASTSGGFLFFPQPSTLAEINSTDTTPEKETTIVAVEGSILAVTPVEDASSNPLGWDVTLEDSSGSGLSFLNLSAEHTVDQWPFFISGAEVRMTGVLLKDGTDYEVAPRGPYDLSISIEDARDVPDGEKVLIRGNVCMVPGALSGGLEYGFSLHEENGTGILISVADAGGLYTDYDGDQQLEFADGTSRPFDLPTFHDLADPYPFAANSQVPVALHVEGVMASTVSGDRYVIANPNQIRRVAEDTDYPLFASLSTGAVSSSDLGRFIRVDGTMTNPPTGGGDYPGGAGGWKLFAEGYRATIDDGSGEIDILLPYGIIFDSDGDLSLELQDLEQYPISVNIGDPLTVYGFLRDNNGSLELIVASVGALETSPGVFEYFIY